MRIVVSLLFVLVPAVALAQNYQPNEADLQNMMVQMQKMQECMQNVDRGELQALEQRSDEMETEVKSLCESGKRDEAQKKAMSYAKEMMDNPALIQMKKCGEIAKGSIPPGMMSPEEEEGYEDFDFSKHHVCDEE